jgi:hypothetical protein
MKRASKNTVVRRKWTWCLKNQAVFQDCASERLRVVLRWGIEYSFHQRSSDSCESRCDAWSAHLCIMVQQYLLLALLYSIAKPKAQRLTF